METQSISPSPAALVALSGDLAGAVERVAGAIVAIDAGRRRPSSGIAWDEHHVVTADHAIEDEHVTLTLASGTTVPAHVVARDASTDIALVRTDAQLQPATRASLDGLRVGHAVLAVARDDDGAVAASFGVVSSLDGAWRTWRGGDIDRFIRPDLSLYPGFSGGALVDIEGRTIGMNTWGLSRRTALTIPVTTLDRVVAQLASGGQKAGYLGVALAEVRIPPVLRERHGIEHDGAVVIVDIAPGSPGDRAGAVIGDVILALAGSRVTDAHDLQRALRGDIVGTSTTLRVLRGGEPRDLAVTIGERSRSDDD